MSNPAPRPIRTVYLAGKISGNQWRDQIIGWSFENHNCGIDYCDIADNRRWPITYGVVPVPNGRKLDFTGPYWVPLDSGIAQHGDIDSAAVGLHRCGETLGEPHDGMAVSHPFQTRDEIMAAINRSDMVFAWIDSLDCFGTLFEIGVAAAWGKVVIVATHPGFDYREVWLSLSAATRVIHASNPSQAWNDLWTTTGSAFDPIYEEKVDAPDPREGLSDGDCDPCTGENLIADPVTGELYVPSERM